MTYHFCDADITASQEFSSVFLTVRFSYQLLEGILELYRLVFSENAATGT